MDKRKLFGVFAAQMASTLEAVRTAAAAAHDAATNPESKAENEYDTRGLEAGYLAEAQSRRALELETLLAMFRTLENAPELRVFDRSTPIGPSALITVECDGQESRYVLLPSGGGLSASLDGKVVQVVTPQSPLGQALLGKRVDDEVELQVQGRLRDYTILAVD